MIGSLEPAGLGSDGVHPSALVESRSLGPDCRIGAFTHIRASAVIGRGARIDEYVLVDDDVKVGDHVTVGCGVQLFAGMRVDDHVSIGANTTFSSDDFSVGEPIGSANASTTISQGAVIGANATVYPGVSIGRRALVRPGAVVMHNVPPYAIVAGNPSQIVGYVDIVQPAISAPGAAGTGSLKLRVKDASLVQIPKVVDLRGTTSFAEIDAHLPFVIKRFFVVCDVPGREVRGEHAHKTLHEFLVPLKGSFAVVLDDGQVREEVPMDSPNIGLHVPPQVWRVVYKYTPDTVMLSLCSHVYDPQDYIRDHAEFLQFVGAK